jgi:hypothetical protein
MHPKLHGQRCLPHLEDAFFSRIHLSQPFKWPSWPHDHNTARIADVQLPPRSEVKLDYCSPFHPKKGPRVSLFALWCPMMYSFQLTRMINFIEDIHDSRHNMIDTIPINTHFRYKRQLDNIIIIIAYYYYYYYYIYNIYS